LVGQLNGKPEAHHPDREDRVKDHMRIMQEIGSTICGRFGFALIAVEES